MQIVFHIMAELSSLNCTPTLPIASSNQENSLKSTRQFSYNCGAYLSIRLDGFTTSTSSPSCWGAIESFQALVSALYG